MSTPTFPAVDSQGSFKAQSVWDRIIEAVAERFATALHVRPGKKGVLGVGAGDDTAAIQSILDQVNPTKGIVDVYVHDGTYMINGVNMESVVKHNNRYHASIDAGLLPREGTRIHMTPGATLKVIPNGWPAYACIYLGPTAKNIRITGGHILGDRAEHDFENPDIPASHSSHEWGAGILFRGAKDIVIDRVNISGCTGDGLQIANEMPYTAQSPDYNPTERVTIKNCTIEGSRRNNISATGCDHITVENNLIKGAGIHDGHWDGVAPRYGMDIEGYAEGGVDYMTAYNVTVRGNRFVGNAAGSVTNHNGYKVAIEGNFSDHSISVGWGRETTVRGNLLENLDKTLSYGIGSLRELSHLTGSRSIIANNIIRGFKAGISAQRDKITITGNAVCDFAETGISMFNADQCLVAGNMLFDGGETSNGLRVAGCQDTTIADNKLWNVYRGMIFQTGEANNKGVMVKGNEVKQAYQGFRVEQGSQVTLKGNATNLAGHAAGQNYDFSWTAGTDVLCIDNVARNSSAFAISASMSATGVSRIIGNKIIDHTYLHAINANGTGAHEIVGNTFVSANPTGGASPCPIALGGTQDKATVIDNKAWGKTGAGQYNKLVNCSGSTVTNTRVLGNRVIGNTPVAITGDAGTPVDQGNILIPA